MERDQADLAIIVAPKSMIGEWPNDLKRFRGDIYRTVVLTGPTREKRRLLAEGADVFVTNFETAVATYSVPSGIRPPEVARSPESLSGAVGPDAVRLEDITAAIAFCRSFFPWYNTEHRHAGIAMLTPDDVHHHRAPDVLAKRGRTLQAAWALHPERFVHGTPKPAPLPKAVWINPPATSTTGETSQ